VAGREPSTAPDDALPLARRLARAREAGALSLFFRRTRTVQRLPMVGWFDPGQLFDTGLKTLFSTIVGERSDRRMIQALAARRPDIYDYSHHYVDTEQGPHVARDRPRDELWVDYVCDTGDGWNSTYAVAYALAQRELPLADGRRLPRGDLLVFGGDEVYPAASRENYNRRLVVPFATAFGDEEPDESPHVFAIPGNHDWYDGLGAFSRLFMSDIGGRWFAAWATRQSRSYFALRLPNRWWLLGSDGQLQSDIDTPQLEYFRHVAATHMHPGDRAIMCLSQPTWIYAHKYRQLGGELDETDLLYLREQVFAPRGVELRVFLAGDLHHYRRHAEVGAAPGEAMQKITAGGGGAFLHPTHDEDVARLEEDAGLVDGGTRQFALAAAYPDARTSNRLAWGNLLFPFCNPKFGVVPATLYLLTAWLVGAALGAPPRPTGLFATLRGTVEAFRLHPGLALWVIALVALFVTFTDTASRVHRWVGGGLHFLAHWSAIFLLGVASVATSRFLPAEWVVSRFTYETAFMFAGGWIAGSLIMGLYLLVSLNVFGRHSEEAFSSMRIADYKHFLRLHVGRDGTLTIYPIRIERVPRRWRDRRAGDATASRVVPEEPLLPALIEEPIVVRGAADYEDPLRTEAARSKVG
jgi:hypothetical protein